MADSLSPPPDVIVIGAGIIGISAAFALQRRGRAVLVIDRDEPVRGASTGNAGAFAFSDLEPLAAPGILRRAPGWLIDPLGPLSIRPRHALRLAPWLWQFWRASRPARYRAGVAAQAALNTLSRAALDRLVAATGGETFLRRQGQLQLFDSAASFRASLPAWELRRAHGVRFDLLDSAGAIAEIQPGLAPHLAHAGFTPDWVNVTDPADWLAHLTRAFRAAGGQLRKADVQRILPAEGGQRLTLAGGETLAAPRVVLAAGAWSHLLARDLGERLPLDTERGYNTTLPAPEFDLRTHLTFADHAFVVTQAQGGIRVGGAVELGGLHLPPDYRRARVLLDKAQRFMPGLSDAGGVQWMGFRPSLPDSLPVIGRARAAPGLILAFGHGHLGLTQSPATAEIVADLVCDHAPAIDIAPYRPGRFGLFRSRAVTSSPLTAIEGATP